MKAFFEKFVGSIPFFLLGILCTVFSFLLCFYWDVLQSPVVATLVYAIDGCFLIANTYYIADRLSKTRRQKVLNTILGCLLYLSMFLFLGGWLFEDRLTLELFFNIFQVALFLAPVLVILLPIYYLIVYILGG